MIQIPTQSPGRYTAELPLRRIKLFSFQANSPYVPSTHTGFLYSTKRNETDETKLTKLVSRNRRNETTLE